MKYFRLALSTLLLATLIACGSDDDDGDVNGDVAGDVAGDEVDEGGGEEVDEEIDNGTGGGAADASQVALQAIAGVWDTTDFEDEQQDVSFSVIRADGSASDYDYLGDEFDNLEDCYLRINFDITHVGDSRFTITSSEFENDENDLFDISVQDGNLVTLLIGDETPDIFPPADLTEADFTPLCDSSFE